MSSKASSLQTKNSAFKRSGKRPDCLIPKSQKRKEVWVSGYKFSVLKSEMYSKRGCTVLYTLHMIPLLRPGTVHHLYYPGCLAFSSLLDFLCIPLAQELELMKQTSNSTFHLVWPSHRVVLTCGVISWLILQLLTFTISAANMVTISLLIPRPLVVLFPTTHSLIPIPFVVSFPYHL